MGDQNYKLISQYANIMSIHIYMRHTILILVTLLSFTSRVSAQEMIVTFSSRDLTAQQVIDQITARTPYRFILKSGEFSFSHRVVLPASAVTIKEALATIVAGTGKTYSIDGNYIVLPVDAPKEEAKPTPVKTVVPQQPTRAEFERDVDQYTRTNIAPPAGEQTIIRYDTIRTAKPHNGVFNYPSQRVAINGTRRTASTSFLRNTPPHFAIKTNAVWWAAMGTINIGAEVGLNSRTSLELSLGYNPWGVRFEESDDFNEKKLAHEMIKLEYRYWLCERFSGHFFGVHGFYGEYNVGGWDIPMLFEKEFRYDGNTYGGGDRKSVV